MREWVHWKLVFFRYKNMQVSLHAFFIALALYVLVMAWRGGGQPALIAAGFGLAYLLLCVVLHELAHVVTARAVQGDAEEIILWPLGGLQFPILSAWGKDDQVAAQEELLVSIAGPFFNLILCVLTIPLLLTFQLPLAELLNPLVPPRTLSGLPLYVGLTFWINWSLFILNMLPAATLDGGVMIRALLWKAIGQSAATIWASRVSMVMSVLLITVAVFLPEPYNAGTLPLVLLGVLVLMASRVEVEMPGDNHESDTFMGYDFSQGYTSLERDPEHEAPVAEESGPFQKWLKNRQQRRAERQREQEEEDERRVDEILERIHQKGASALTEEEKQVLLRVSERYRSRQQ